MSRTFSMKNGLDDSLNVSTRCGCNENARQMREIADGSIAKIRERTEWLRWQCELRGYSEQLANEVCLTRGIVLGYPPHSALSHHRHRLDPSQRPPCCRQRTVAFRQPRSAFDIAMVLLHHVV